MLLLFLTIVVVVIGGVVSVVVVVASSAVVVWCCCCCCCGIIAKRLVKQFSRQDIGFFSKTAAPMTTMRNSAKAAHCYAPTHTHRHTQHTHTSSLVDVVVQQSLELGISYQNFISDGPKRSAAQ